MIERERNGQGTRWGARGRRGRFDESCSSSQGTPELIYPYNPSSEMLSAALQSRIPIRARAQKSPCSTGACSPRSRVLPRAVMKRGAVGTWTHEELVILRGLNGSILGEVSAVSGWIERGDVSEGRVLGEVRVRRERERESKSLHDSDGLFELSGSVGHDSYLGSLIESGRRQKRGRLGQA